MMRRLLHDERGMALAITMMILLILSLTTAALLTSVAVNHRSSLRSTEQRKAFALAEVALAYAEGAVYSAAASHQTPPAGSQTIPTQATGGTGTYVISVGPDAITWTMSGTGTVDGISRTVSAQAHVPSPQTVTDTGVWNYLYADSSAPHTCANTWDTFQGGTTIAVPVLTRGDLCITGGAHYTGTQLEVGGKLIIQGGSNIGTSTTKIDKLNIGGSPSSSACSSNGTIVTPGTGVCDGAHSPIFAKAVTPTLSLTPQMPPIDLQTEYTNQAAMSKTGCPANLFDNNTTMNNSLTAAALTATMFPSNSSYDCHVGSSEIKWNSAGKFCSNATLLVSGQMIFDGSLDLTCGFNIVYTGQASLAFTGTVLFEGGIKLCGIANCTTSWNPDVNGIIVIAGCWANSTGSTLVNSGCVHVTAGSSVQLGAYSKQDYQIDGGSSNMGPVLANTLTINGGSASLIPFHTMPPGTPLNSRTTYLPADPPTNWSG